MDEDKLYVVIPVLNRWPQTRQCVQRLMDQGQPPAHILVVDHGSTDGTREGLEREFPKVPRLESDLEHWWTGATNTGVRAALDRGAERVMLMNNDCLLATGSLARLLRYADEHPDMVIAPVQRDSNGRIRVVRSGTLLLAGFPTIVWPGSRRGVGVSGLLSTGLIVGGRGVIIPRVVFERIGLFDEHRLPHYSADHDFYLRCRKQHIPLRIAADAYVDVDHSDSTLASNLGQLTWSGFLASLRGRRSHQNLHDLSALFRLHYPIPGLWWLGVGLNLLRYTLVYTLARSTSLLKPAQK